MTNAELLTHLETGFERESTLNQHNFNQKHKAATTTKGYPWVSRVAVSRRLTEGIAAPQGAVGVWDRL